jgi:hypothetical protein
MNVHNNKSHDNTSQPGSTSCPPASTVSFLPGKKIADKREAFLSPVVKPVPMPSTEDVTNAKGNSSRRGSSSRRTSFASLLDENCVGHLNDEDDLEQNSDDASMQPAVDQNSRFDLSFADLATMMIPPKLTDMNEERTKRPMQNTRHNSFPADSMFGGRNLEGNAVNDQPNGKFDANGVPVRDLIAMKIAYKQRTGRKENAGRRYSC